MHLRITVSETANVLKVARETMIDRQENCNKSRKIASNETFEEIMLATLKIYRNNYIKIFNFNSIC